MRDKIRLIVMVCLVALAVLSAARGVQNAMSGSQDFQWSGTRILLQGDNPYAVKLAGDPDSRILLSQAPNYAHTLYLSLVPYGLLDFDAARLAWALTNIGFAAALVAMMRRIFRLSWWQTGLVGAVFICSTPLRNGIGNGQHALFSLTFLALPFALGGARSFVVQGFGYSKYSFAPPFFFFAMFKHGWRAAVMSLLVPVGAVLMFSAIVQENPLLVAIQPLQVSAVSTDPGLSDLMTLLQKYLPGSAISTAISYLAPLSVSALLAWWVASHPLSLVWLPGLALTALVSFKHLTYDYSFLLPVWCLAVLTSDKIVKICLLMTIAYFWFGLKLIDVLDADLGDAKALIGFALLTVSLATLLLSKALTDQQVVATEAARDSR
jgi:hypothetical protein